MRFQKVKYINRDTGEKNINISKRVEYFLHYWNFVFHEQRNIGLLLIHQEKLESHRSLIHKIEVQINENKSKYGKRIKSLFIEHPYFQESNLIIRKSPKSKSEITKFKNNFNTTWFAGGINDKKNLRNQPIIKTEFEKIKKNVLRNYLNRLIKAVVTQLVTDKSVNKTFKKDIQFLINAVIVELYHNEFSIDYIRKIANIIIFPKEHKNQFPYDKTFHDFGEKELFYNKYKERTLKKINLHEQIACINNFVDNKKYPKQKGFCIFKIDDFDFQLEEPIDIWGVTFYNPQKTRKVKARTSGTESIEVDFNNSISPKPSNFIESTCNAIIKVDYRIFDWNNHVIAIHQVISKVDKALQVLKKLKLDFVNGNGTVSGRVSTKICVFTDIEYNHRQYVNIQTDHYSFEIEEYQKSVFKDVLRDIKLYQKNQKLMDIYAYLCQAKTDEFAFNFKDYWTVLAEANFPNKPKEFIEKCKDIFKNKLSNRLFKDTKILLNNSLCSGTIYWPESEYSLKEYISKQVGINIPEKQRFNCERFKKNYEELKKYAGFEFLNDIFDELDECINKPEKYANRIDKWLEDTIDSVYAERNLESHNNIVTDYSLIKLKEEFLYIGEIFLLSKLKGL